MESKFFFSPIIIILAMIMSSCGSGIVKNVDDNSNSSNKLEDKEYFSITIGNQVWATKNLNVSNFKNGDPIPIIESTEEWEIAGKEGKPACCSIDNNAENDINYGKLYNWYAVNDPRGIAPKGWHIPNDEEWSILSNFLGGDEVAGAKMKSADGWKGNGNGTNESGFSAIPCGFRTLEGKLKNDKGEGCLWWSANEDGIKMAYYSALGYTYSKLFRSSHFKRNGMSVRCLKD